MRQRRGQTALGYAATNLFKAAALALFCNTADWDTASWKQTSRALLALSDDLLHTVRQQCSAARLTLACFARLSFNLHRALLVAHAVQTGGEVHLSLAVAPRVRDAKLAVRARAKPLAPAHACRSAARRSRGCFAAPSASTSAAACPTDRCFAGAGLQRTTAAAALGALCASMVGLANGCRHDATLKRWNSQAYTSRQSRARSSRIRAMRSHRNGTH